MPEQPSGEWVRLSEWKADPPIVQSLTAVHIWPTLTAKQKQLVAGCRVEVDPEATFPDRYKVLVDGTAGAPAATLRSLQVKGVVDERGRLTIPGIYTALWNGMEHDADRRAQRAANRDALALLGEVQR